jgi:putative addiction module killer protein
VVRGAAQGFAFGEPSDLNRRNTFPLTKGVVYDTIALRMITLEVYTTEDGKQPFIKWLEGIDRQARRRVTIALERLEDGNTGALKSVGDGVHEIRLTYGPGYRVYLGQRGQTLVILLHGGTKRRQSDDIAKAKALWRDYLDEENRKET